MDVFKDVLGLPFDEARMRELLTVYEPILGEIRKLREVELKEVSPAVSFDPRRAYLDDKEVWNDA